MTLLQQILQDKEDELVRAKSARPLVELQSKIKDTPKALSFRDALTNTGFGVIAEIKRKSPSMADMLPANVEEAPHAYKDSDFVKAVSILTDWKYFGMTVDELTRLKDLIGKPALRKDFIFDEYQVHEARACGADAILLMACVLEKASLRRLFDLATELGMDVLFECHSREEIDMIPDKARIVGINSRKFKASQSSLRYTGSRLLGRLKLFGKFGIKDFSTDLEVFRELVHALPPGVIKVAESGITPATLSRVRELGFDCALIGTSLLKSSTGVQEMINALREASNHLPVLTEKSGLAGT